MEGSSKSNNIGGSSSHAGASGQKRERGYSQEGGIGGSRGQLGLEELTVMKLMEEIMEFDQEIKMKQRWINARMKLLHNLLGQQEKKEMKQIIQNFLLKLQPEYPKKISVNYDRGGEAIPMPMDSGEAIPLEMFKGDPIMLMSREEQEASMGGAQVVDIEDAEEAKKE